MYFLVTTMAESRVQSSIQTNEILFSSFVGVIVPLGLNVTMSRTFSCFNLRPWLRKCRYTFAVSRDLIVIQHMRTRGSSCPTDLLKRRHNIVKICNTATATRMTSRRYVLEQQTELRREPPPNPTSVRAAEVGCRRFPSKMYSDFSPRRLFEKKHRFPPLS